MAEKTSLAGSSHDQHGGVSVKDGSEKETVTVSREDASGPTTGPRPKMQYEQGR
jgi:hypothetical protein